MESKGKQGARRVPGDSGTETPVKPLLMVSWSEAPKGRD